MSKSMVVDETKVCSLLHASRRVFQTTWQPLTDLDAPSLHPTPLQFLPGAICTPQVQPKDDLERLATHVTPIRGTRYSKCLS